MTMTMTMALDCIPSYALTIRQPWAALIGAGDYRVLPRVRKRIETRTWRPSGARLPIGAYLAIHAGAEVDEEARDLLAALDRTPQWPLRWAHLASARQSLIAIAQISGYREVYPTREDARACITAALSDEQARRCAAWMADGMQTRLQGWVCTNVTALERPLCMRGHQGLWPLSAEQRAELGALLERRAA